MKDTEESVKWRRGHGGDAFQIREQYVLLHKVQDHSAPKGDLSLQAWLQPGVGSMYGKGKRGAWALSGPVSDLEWHAKDIMF